MLVHDEGADRSGAIDDGVDPSEVGKQLGSTPSRQSPAESTAVGAMSVEAAGVEFAEPVAGRWADPVGDVPTSRDVTGTSEINSSDTARTTVSTSPRRAWRRSLPLEA
jgi:hypothetical protein